MRTAAQGLPPRAPAGTLNVLLLVAGFGLGQGSVFLVQTFLLAAGRLDLIALFGLHLSLATLAVLVIEAGSLTVLARHVAEGRARGADLWRLYWETCLVRGIVASGVLLAVAGVLAFRGVHGFSVAYAVFAAPASAAAALSAAGLLDGLRLSGVSGLAASAAAIASALALPLARDLPPASAGAVLGAAFTLGHALALAIQSAALRRAGFAPRLARPTRAGMVRAGRDGIAMLGVTLPGQVFFRAQLLMSAAFLGTDATALFLYVTQIVAGLVQLLGFARRVAFPGLVAQLADPAGGRVATLLASQAKATAAALAMVLVLVTAGLALPATGHGLAGAGPPLALFAILVLSSHLALAAGQGLMALGRYPDAAATTLLAVAAGLALSLLLSPRLGLAGFALANLAQDAIALALAVRFLRERSPR
ncbi:hypothetical protein [Ensifer soli]|uniref:hypothetical protein n=1 Tax=Ciceribacter sp. sgz301302 TaxID=3342379 RepID=UPI0035BB2D12